jgi:hypothetical protein
MDSADSILTLTVSDDETGGTGVGALDFRLSQNVRSPRRSMRRVLQWEW